MARIELTVCDVCEKPDRGTMHYSIATGDKRKGEADLCEEHARPIEHLLGDPRERNPLPPPTPRKVAVKRAAKKATNGRSRRALGAPVTTLEAIEGAKKGVGKP